MVRITRRPQAEEDILEIWLFIAEDNVAAADRWFDRLDEILFLCATQPTMGRVRDELAPGLRSFPFGCYVVFYEPLHDGIDVVRVLHSSQETDPQFHS